MSQFEGTAVRTIKPSSNVYTVLMFVSVLALGVAAGVLGWKNVQWTEGAQEAIDANPVLRPFVIVKNKTD